MENTDLLVLLKTKKPYLFIDQLRKCSINNSIVCHILKNNYVSALKCLIAMQHIDFMKIDLLQCVLQTCIEISMDASLNDERAIVPELAINLCLAYASNLVNDTILKPMYSIQQYSQLYKYMCSSGNYTGLLLLDKYMAITHCEHYIGRLCSDCNIVKSAYSTYLICNNILCLMHVLIHASNKTPYHLRIIEKYFDTEPTFQDECKYIAQHCSIALN